MKRLLFLGLMTAGILCFAISSVHAYALDSYMLNFSAAAEAESDSSGILDIENADEWQFLARSVLGFTDGGTGDAGTLTVGDTFVNYVAVRVTGITDKNDGEVHTSSYGASRDSTHELTALIELSGTQTTTTSYTIDSLNRFDIYFDAGTFTASDFTDLNTFVDGTKVETASLIAGGGINSDPLQITGTLSMLLNLEDLLHNNSAANNEYFELDDNGEVFDMNLVMGIIDTGVDIEENDDILSAFESFFTFNENNYDFIFQTSNDGSFNKEVVPEPTTFLLLGIGLISLASVSRKRHIS